MNTESRTCYILKGKHKGKVAEVSQWANDWFSIEVDGRQLIVSPSSILITQHVFKAVQADKSKGQLLSWFQPYEEIEGSKIINDVLYVIGFKKRKPLNI